MLEYLLSSTNFVHNFSLFCFLLDLISRHYIIQSNVCIKSTLTCERVSESEQINKEGNDLNWLNTATECAEFRFFHHNLLFTPFNHGRVWVNNELFSFADKTKTRARSLMKPNKNKKSGERNPRTREREQERWESDWWTEAQTITVKKQSLENDNVCKHHQEREKLRLEFVDLLKNTAQR